MPKGKREDTYGPFNSRSAEGGASTKKEFPKGKLPRTPSRWWNKCDLPLMPHIQVRRKKRTQNMLIF